MVTQAVTKVETVKRLFSVIEMRKELEKEEKSLKTQVKEFMGENLILEAGGFCVNIDSRTRKDLDKDALMHDMGLEFVNKYTKSSTYDVMTVKPSVRLGIA